MITEILQVAACVALIAAAMYWKFTRSCVQGTHKFLFPFILTASILGIALIAPYAIEVFVAYYSGAIYEVEAMNFRFNGSYGWVYYSGFILPLLPIFAVLPQIGSRPILVALVGMLAMVPVVFDHVVRFLN
ncbi:MAG: hypothetical protein V4727_04710 [Verrucomicrobiota bacterium]